MARKVVLGVVMIRGLVSIAGNQWRFIYLERETASSIVNYKDLHPP